MTTFKNPLKSGADPYVLYHAPYYYALDTGCAYENGNATHFTLRRHRDLAKVFTEGEKHLVPIPKATHFPQAPELHYWKGRFYILYSLAFFDGATVLESEGDDPFSTYTLKTQSLGQNTVANLQTYDHTMFTCSDGSLWGCAACYELMVIYRLSDPCTIDGDVVTFVWADRDYENGLVEAPFFIEREGVIHIMYSSGRYQDDTYSVGLLTFDGAVGDDLRDPNRWRKAEGTVFEQYENVTGTGHNCIVPSPDGERYWHVYHGHTPPGTEERHIFIQPMEWDGAYPVFGRPFPANTPIKMD